MARTPAVELPLEVAWFEQNATFFSSMPGVGSEAPNRNNAMRPSVTSIFLRRSGVWNARTKAVSMGSPRFGRSGSPRSLPGTPSFFFFGQESSVTVPPACSIFWAAVAEKACAVTRRATERSPVPSTLISSPRRAAPLATRFSGVTSPPSGYS